MKNHFIQRISLRVSDYQSDTAERLGHEVEKKVWLEACMYRGSLSLSLSLALALALLLSLTFFCQANMPHLYTHPLPQAGEGRFNFLRTQEKSDKLRDPTPTGGH